MTTEIMRDGWLGTWLHLARARDAFDATKTDDEACAALANMRSAAETFRCACSGYIGAITNEETVRTAARDRETSEEIDKLRRAVAKESMRDQVALAAGLDDAGIEKVP